MSSGNLVKRLPTACHSISERDVVIKLDIYIPISNVSMVVMVTSKFSREMYVTKTSVLFSHLFRESITIYNFTIIGNNYLIA